MRYFFSLFSLAVIVVTTFGSNFPVFAGDTDWPLRIAASELLFLKKQGEIKGDFLSHVTWRVLKNELFPKQGKSEIEIWKSQFPFDYGNVLRRSLAANRFQQTIARYPHLKTISDQSQSVQAQQLDLASGQYLITHLELLEILSLTPPGSQIEKLKTLSEKVFTQINSLPLDVIDRAMQSFSPEVQLRVLLTLLPSPNSGDFKLRLTGSQLIWMLKMIPKVRVETENADDFLGLRNRIRAFTRNEKWHARDLTFFRTPLNLALAIKAMDATPQLELLDQEPFSAVLQEFLALNQLSGSVLDPADPTAAKIIQRKVSEESIGKLFSFHQERLIKTMSELLPF